MMSFLSLAGGVEPFTEKGEEREGNGRVWERIGSFVVQGLGRKVMGGWDVAWVTIRKGRR